MNEHVSIGTGYSVFTGAPQLGSPTCSTSFAGPPYSEAGTWYYAYAPVWQNGAVGSFSKPSVNSCTSNGTSQQITIKIPAAIPGVQGYVIGRSSTATVGNMLAPPPSTTTLTEIHPPFTSGGSYPILPGGGPAGITDGNVYATALVLGATPPPKGSATFASWLYMDATSLWPAFKPNGNKPYVVPGISGPIASGHNLCADGTTGAYVDCLTPKTIAAGTATLEARTIPARSCAPAVQISAKSVTLSDVISYSFGAPPSGAYTTGLILQTYVTQDHVNFLVCNPTTDILTPDEITLNWRVVR